MVFFFFFLIFLYKGILCGYSFALHWQVDATQMGTHTIYIYNEINVKIMAFGNKAHTTDK